MDLEEIGINAGELGWFGLGYELLESPCEWGIETPGSISYGVSILLIYYLLYCNLKVSQTACIWKLELNLYPHKLWSIQENKNTTLSCEFYKVTQKVYSHLSRFLCLQFCKELFKITICEWIYFSYRIAEGTPFITARSRKEIFHHFLSSYYSTFYPPLNHTPLFSQKERLSKTVCVALNLLKKAFY